MRQMTVRSNIIHSVTQQTYFLNLLSYLNMLRDVLSYTRFLSWTLNTPIFCKMAARSQVYNLKRSYSLLEHTPLESSISFLNFLTNSKSWDFAASGGGIKFLKLKKCRNLRETDQEPRNEFGKHAKNKIAGVRSFQASVRKS